MAKKLSIIIPTLNEEAHLGKLVKHLREVCFDLRQTEILVVDGGSNDKTIAIAAKNEVRVLASPKGRAKQMNFGAKNATGEILYFLHADTLPPLYFDKAIRNAVGAGYESGCFRMKFDTKNLFLTFFSFLTRFNFLVCRGGDQSLFVTRTTFLNAGSYNENYIIYEDLNLIARLYKTSRFKVIPQKVITSSRKYKKNGFLKLQYHFGIIHLKHFLGFGPERLYTYYKNHIK